MTNKNILSLLVAASAFSATAAFAQTTSSQSTNSSTVKMSDMQKPEEKKTDIDDEITDARMRAQLGSKSSWSFKSNFSYSGGSIDDPFNGVRPNYRASASLESLTSLSGDIGINYRVTGKDSISFGTGVTIVDPLHGDVTKPATDDRKSGKGETVSRYEVSTPYLGWSRGYKALDSQMISSLTYSHATDADSVNLMKRFGSLSFSQTVLANFGTSKWTGGTSLNLGATFNTGDVTDPKIVKAMEKGLIKRSDYSVGLFPFLQYTFNDRYSFRTVFGYFQFSHYENYSDLYQLEPYQSVGTGISITRDIYLYPNVQFTPKDIRSDRTNVALSANINLF